MNWKVNPVEHDKKLSELYYEQIGLMNKIASAENSVKFYKKYPDKWGNSAERAQQDYEVAVANYKAKVAEVNAMEKQYEGWSRAFLVQNSNGHVHRSMRCHSCYASTVFIWLPELSGSDEDGIIKAAGEKACSVCYPDAPSEYLARKCELEDPAVVKAREERAIAKAERDAKAKEKGISNPDGSPLKVQAWRYKEHIKAERSAQIYAVDNQFWMDEFDEKPREHQLEERAYREANQEIVLVALAFKRGVEVEVVKAEIAVKVAKKKIQFEKISAKHREMYPDWYANQ